jgi:hypothetical protein
VWRLQAGFAIVAKHVEAPDFLHEWRDTWLNSPAVFLHELRDTWERLNSL